MIRGVVINIHAHGAIVRLEDGSLVAVPASELAAHRHAYVASLANRSQLALALDTRGRHPIVTLEGSPVAASVSQASPAPELMNLEFEQRIGTYLKETEAWAPPDRPAPSERHFIRKKRRAALFEARNKPT